MLTRQPPLWPWDLDKTCSGPVDSRRGCVGIRWFASPPLSLLRSPRSCLAIIASRPSPNLAPSRSSLQIIGVSVGPFFLLFGKYFLSRLARGHREFYFLALRRRHWVQVRSGFGLTTAKQPQHRASPRVRIVSSYCNAQGTDLLGRGVRVKRRVYPAYACLKTIVLCMG